MRVSSLVALATLLLCVLACDQDKATASHSRRMTFPEFRAAVRSSGVWSGGPEENFELVGRNTLATAIQYGLLPNHKVLDVGAGSLRVGWWLLQYVEPSNYYAIEPNRKMIDPIAEKIGAPIHIYYNDDWEFPPIQFDFVIARSIWTHASKWMISKMLSEFVENSAPDARFLTSVRFAQTDQEDYKGDEWVGRSHKSDQPGMVKHSRKWIEDECRKHGLALEVKETLGGQTWLLIRRSGIGA